MKVILNPIVALPNEQADNPPTVNGDILNYRGQTYDLSQLPEGAEVETELPFVGLIKRLNGQIELSLEFKYNSSLAEANQPTSVESYTFVLESGQCTDSIIYKPIEVDSND